MGMQNPVYHDPAKYVHKQLDESNACLHHLKLDLGSAFNFSWRMVHNDMLMRH